VIERELEAIYNEKATEREIYIYKENEFQTQHLLQGTGGSGDSPSHRYGDRERKKNH